MSGSTAQMESAKKQIMAMIPNEKHEQFNKDFEATMPGFYDKIADIYLKEYTHQEVKEMLKFSMRNLLVYAYWQSLLWFEMI